MNLSFFHRMVACLLAVSAWTGQAFGGAFTVGDVVILRVGDGSSAIGTNAAAVSLLEYTMTGTLVQTINIASTGSSAEISRRLWRRSLNSVFPQGIFLRRRL